MNPIPPSQGLLPPPPAEAPQEPRPYPAAAAAAAAAAPRFDDEPKNWVFSSPTSREYESETRIAQNHSSEERFVARISRDKQFNRNIQNEAALLDILPNVPKQRALFFLQERACLIHSSFPNTLLDLAEQEPISFEKLVMSAIEVLKPLCRLAEKGYAHGDLKTDTIGLQNNIAHLTSLHRLHPCESVAPLHSLQNIYFRAPECLLGHRRITPSIDIWSLGIILFELFTKMRFIEDVGQSAGEKEVLEHRETALSFIVQFIGYPPKSLLADARDSSLLWCLEEWRRDTPHIEPILNGMLASAAQERGLSEPAYERWSRLILKMICYEDRISAKDALQACREILALVGGKIPDLEEEKTALKLPISDPRRWRRLEKLGEGVSSTVWKVEDVALKIFCAAKISKSPEYNVLIQQEGNLLQNLARYQVPHIPTYYTSFECNQQAWLVETLLPETLFKLARTKVEFSRIISIATQILESLKELSGLNFAHADLKLSNLGQKEDQVWLLDFGLLHDCAEKIIPNQLQTIDVRSPECLLGHEFATPSIDIWTLGCILAHLFIGKDLFQATADNLETQRSMLTQIIQAIGYPSKEFISKCPLRISSDNRQYPNLLAYALRDLKQNGAPTLANTLRACAEERKMAAPLREKWVELILKMVCYEDRISAADALAACREISKM